MTHGRPAAETVRNVRPGRANRTKGILMSKYEVKSGDTLWKLAERFYGDGRLHPVIAVINDLSNPDHIVVGQELEIP